MMTSADGTGSNEFNPVVARNELTAVAILLRRKVRRNDGISG
jgi:hypothetical protein